jgi:hypothetical protein
VAFLRLERKRCDRACFKTLERNRLAGLFAVAVGSVVDALDRRIDLRNQLALAIARPQFDRPVGLRRGAVGQVRVVLILVLQIFQGLLGLLQDVFLPVEQLLSEIVPLALVHEGLFLGRPVIRLFNQAHPSPTPCTCFPFARAWPRAPYIGDSRH